MKDEICRKCGVILSDINWYASLKKLKNYICKTCFNLQTKKWSENNPEKIKIIKEKFKNKYPNYKTEWWRNNKESSKKSYKKYHDNNPQIKRAYYNKNKQKIIINQTKYSKTPKGKEIRRRCQYRRQRNLESIPLNSKFFNSIGHHINNKYIIYIPKEWHQNIYHNMKKGINIEQINTMAYFFLLQQNILELNKLFKN